jgi:hypothetical protein
MYGELSSRSDALKWQPPLGNLVIELKCGGNWPEIDVRTPVWISYWIDAVRAPIICVHKFQVQCCIQLNMCRTPSRALCQDNLSTFTQRRVANSLILSSRLKSAVPSVIREGQERGQRERERETERERESREKRRSPWSGMTRALPEPMGVSLSHHRQVV